MTQDVISPHIMYCFFSSVTQLTPHPHTHTPAHHTKHYREQPVFPKQKPQLAKLPSGHLVRNCIISSVDIHLRVTSLSLVIWQYNSSPFPDTHVNEGSRKCLRLRWGRLYRTHEMKRRLSQTMDRDTHVNFEDQQNINLFARKNAKLQDILEQIAEKEVSVDFFFFSCVRLCALYMVCRKICRT